MDSLWYLMIGVHRVCDASGWSTYDQRYQTGLALGKSSGPRCTRAVTQGAMQRFSSLMRFPAMGDDRTWWRCYVANDMRRVATILTRSILPERIVGGECRETLNTHNPSDVVQHLLDVALVVPRLQQLRPSAKRHIGHDVVSSRPTPQSPSENRVRYAAAERTHAKNPNQCPILSTAPLCSSNRATSWRARLAMSCSYSFIAPWLMPRLQLFRRCR